MINYAQKNTEADAPRTPAAQDEHIAPSPRVSVQAFCETVETASAVQAAGEDRRLGKAHLKIQMGGMAAAIEAYSNAPTPNVVILETEGRGDILAGLDHLASVCDAGTRVVVIGRTNDVLLYRELVRRGVSDYVIAPVDANRRRPRDLQPVLDAGREAGRPHHRDDRRQGRRRRLDHRSQHRLGDRPRSRARLRRRRPRSCLRHRRPRLQSGSDARASPMRCSRRIASTPPSSTGCCRSAPII